MSKASREMWQLLAQKNEDPDWFPAEMERLQEGATVEELAAIAQVHFSIYRNWIRGDANRESALADAERERKSRKMAKVLQAAFDTALSKPEEPVKHSDRLRAIEILLKPAATLEVSGDKATPAITISFVEAVDGKPK